MHYSLNDGFFLLIFFFLKQKEVSKSENEKFVTKATILSSKRFIDNYEYEDFIYLKKSNI